jgi:small redox-active disulfide protein 2
MVTLQILGMGCQKCKALAERTEQAARELGLEYRVEKVTDFERIARFRIMSTPALVVDGALQFAGRVPTVGAIKELLTAKATSGA